MDTIAAHHKHVAARKEQEIARVGKGPPLQNLVLKLVVNDITGAVNWSLLLAFFRHEVRLLQCALNVHPPIFRIWQ
jgi:hypothetical protein